MLLRIKQLWNKTASLFIDMCLDTDEHYTPQQLEMLLPNVGFAALPPLT